MTIASLIVDVAANTAQLRTDVAQVNATLDTMSSAASSAAAMMAGAFSVAAITAYAKEVFSLGDRLQDLSLQFRGHALVTVHAENPVAGAARKGRVLLRAETEPRLLEHVAGVLARDRQGSIGAA